MNMIRLLSRFLQKSGVTEIEFGLMAGLAAAVVITAVGLVGTDVNAVSTRSQSASSELITPGPVPASARHAHELASPRSQADVSPRIPD